MRVQKIIQGHAAIFKADPNVVYSEREAIQLIAAMDCVGHPIQELNCKVRQTHSAICNLFELGFQLDAVSMARDLIPEAERSHNYKIAQDLCDRLIAHFYQTRDISSAKMYKSLFDRFTLNIEHEHQSMVLYGRAIYNHNQVPQVDSKEIDALLTSIKQKLSYNSLWYPYYYYQFKSFVLEGYDLEQLYLKAIAYFENLPVNHTYFINYFSALLVQFYLKNNALEKAENRLRSLESGTLPWFQNYLLLVNVLLKNKDIKSNDVCILIMNHPNFIGLPQPLKKQWRVAYKSSVRILLDYR